MELDFERCYRAVDSRDQRFDGWFYTAVTSTGIYCRPSCPAITPKRQNVRFYPSAAAAQRAGFRACRRCRPDAAPGSPEWDVRADTVGRAMRLIGDGVVDREGVPGLAHRLGYTERHLHRMLTAELGAGPLALARAQRAQTARMLVETTELGLAEIAFAAGFGSVRQFNDTIKEVYGVPPSTLRESLRRRRTPEAGVISLRLAYRPPLHAAALLEFLAARAIAGVDEVADGTYRRALRLPHGTATAELTPQPGARRRHAAARGRPRPRAGRRALPPAVRPGRRPRGRRRRARRRPRARRPGREGAGGTGTARGRRLGDRRPGHRRPADLGAGGPHGARPPGHRRRLPRPGRVARAARQRVRDADRPAGDDPRAGPGDPRRPRRPRSRRRPGGAGRGADRAARHRRLDGRLRRDAGGRRPGRLPTHRPGRAPGREGARPARRTPGARGARRPAGGRGARTP